jgi:hypothetical protein
MNFYIIRNKNHGLETAYQKQNKLNHSIEKTEKEINFEGQSK